MSRTTLAGTSAAVTATAVLGGLASSGANDPWYRALRKPPFQPPPVAFPVVWTALYAAIATASAETIDELPPEEAAAFRQALAANLVLNASWTWLFFRAHRPGLATLESALLTLSTADLARRAHPVSSRAHALLAPYLAWTGFATVLAGSITWLNRRTVSS